MKTSDILSFVVVPIGLFFLGTLVTGIAAVVKFTAYMARSQKAQESTAGSAGEISSKLTQYIDKTDGVLRDFGERLKVMEYITEHYKKNSGL